MEIAELEKKVEEYENGDLYRNSFEWRFEFPEVLDNDGFFLGFDVVIGNPPYIALQKMKQEQKVLSTQGYFTYSKLSDIYCLFYEKGIQILKPQGLLTYITSNSWLRTQYGELLRIYLTRNANPQILVNIEDAQVFDEATVESNILTLIKADYSHSLKATALKEDYNPDISLSDYFDRNALTIAELPESGWVIGSDLEVLLKQKMETQSILLGSLDYEITYGVKTGFNEAFTINKELYDYFVRKNDKNLEIIKPILRGRDLKKYHYEFAGFYMICTFPALKIDIENYPDVKEYLLSFGKDRLEQKGQKGGRKKTFNQWFETQDTISNWQEFKKEKIVWGELSDEQKFTYDESGFYANNTIFILTGKNLKYLLSILNCKLSKWYFEQISTSSGMGTNRWLKYKIELLPIKQISEEEQKPLISLVDQILAAKKENAAADTSAWEREIDALVYQLYGLTADEIAIVEGVSAGMKLLG